MSIKLLSGGAYKVYNMEVDELAAEAFTFGEAVTEARRLLNETYQHHGVFHIIQCGSTESYSIDEGV